MASTKFWSVLLNDFFLSDEFLSCSYPLYTVHVCSPTAWAGVGYIFLLHQGDVSLGQERIVSGVVMVEEKV